MTIDPAKGYHLRVVHYWDEVTIHAPTENWEHLPRADESLDENFWVGPLSSEQDAEAAAQGLARGLDYSVHFCKTCFPERWEGLRLRGERDPTPNWKPPRGRDAKQRRRMTL